MLPEPDVAVARLPRGPGAQLDHRAAVQMRDHFGLVKKHRGGFVIVDADDDPRTGAKGIAQLRRALGAQRHDGFRLFRRAVPDGHLVSRLQERPRKGGPHRTESDHRNFAHIAPPSLRDRNGYHPDKI